MIFCSLVAIITRSRLCDTRRQFHFNFVPSFITISTSIWTTNTFGRTGMRVTMPSQDTKPSISMKSGLRVLRMNHIEFHTDTLELFPVEQTSQLLVFFCVILTAASSSHESRCTQLATFHVCQRHFNLISVQCGIDGDVNWRKHQGVNGLSEWNCSREST